MDMAMEESKAMKEVFIITRLNNGKDNTTVVMKKNRIIGKYNFIIVNLLIIC